MESSTVRPALQECSENLMLCAIETTGHLTQPPEYRALDTHIFGCLYVVVVSKAYRFATLYIH